MVSVWEKSENVLSVWLDLGLVRLHVFHLILKCIQCKIQSVSYDLHCIFLVFVGSRLNVPKDTMRSRHDDSAMNK